MILYSISSVTNKQTKNPLWILVTFIAMFCIWIYLQLQLQAAVGYWFIYSLITQWCFSVSSKCVIWVFSLHFTSVKKYGIICDTFTEWCFVLNQRKQGGLCNLFWDKNCKEKEQGIIAESPIKHSWKLFHNGKNKSIFLVCQ